MTKSEAKIEKTAQLIELTGEALSAVAGGAGKNATFNIFSNQKQYSGATNASFNSRRGYRRR
jgi:hypothetical protein